MKSTPQGTEPGADPASWDDLPLELLGRIFGQIEDRERYLSPIKMIRLIKFLDYHERLSALPPDPMPGNRQSLLSACKDL